MSSLFVVFSCIMNFRYVFDNYLENQKVISKKYRIECISYQKPLYQKTLILLLLSLKVYIYKKKGGRWKGVNDLWKHYINSIDLISCMCPVIFVISVTFYYRLTVEDCFSLQNIDQKSEMGRNPYDYIIMHNYWFVLIVFYDRHDLWLYKRANYNWVYTIIRHYSASCA